MDGIAQIQELMEKRLQKLMRKDLEKLDLDFAGRDVDGIVLFGKSWPKCLSKGRCFEPYDLKYYLNYCEPHSTFWSLSERKGEENISAYTRRLYITKSEQGVDYKRRNAFPVRLINTTLNT